MELLYALVRTDGVASRDRSDFRSGVASCTEADVRTERRLLFGGWYLHGDDASRVHRPVLAGRHLLPEPLLQPGFKLRRSRHLHRIGRVRLQPRLRRSELLDVRTRVLQLPVLRVLSILYHVQRQRDLHADRRVRMQPRLRRSKLLGVRARVLQLSVLRVLRVLYHVQRQRDVHR